MTDALEPHGPSASGLKRAAALAPLSREHHLALVHARRLRRQADPRPGIAAVDLARVLDGFLEFFRTEMDRHFTCEETLLIPLLIEAGYDPSRLTSDHASIRSLVAELSRSQAAPPGPDVLRRLGALIEAHVRFEERDMFEYLQRHLDVAQLAALEDRIERLARESASCLRPSPE